MSSLIELSSAFGDLFALLKPFAKVAGAIADLIKVFK